MRAVLAGTGGRLPVALGVAATVLLLTIRPYVDVGAGRFAFWLLMAAVSVWTVIAMVRRLHAMGHSGMWTMLVAVPLVGLVLLLWMMVGARGGPVREIGLRHGVGLAVIAAVGLFIASRALWQPYATASEAMAPALEAGDYLITRRGVTPARGDVVVYTNPVDGADYLARLIGLPGDTVQMKDGVLHLNGARARMQPREAYGFVARSEGARCTNDPVAEGGLCLRDRWVELLPGVPGHEVLSVGEGPLDNTPPLTVPAGHGFVLGDNRDTARDSRIPREAGGPGFVPLDAVQARVARVAFNTGGGGRLWQAVQ